MPITTTNGGSGVNQLNEHPFGDRRPDLFIDSMIKSAAVLNRFSIVDGVKSKLNVPIFGLNPTGGANLPADGFNSGANCDFEDTFTATVEEKEMSVDTFSWGFKNCKDALESSYRGLMLKKGQLNPETIDAEFRAWIFDRFAKLASEKALIKAGTDLLNAMKTGSDAVPSGTGEQVVDLALAGATLDSSNILDKMLEGYQAMTDVMLSAIYGDADREYRPAYFLGTAAYQAFQIAMTESFSDSMAIANSNDIAKGSIPSYYGMEVIHFPSLSADHYFIAAPSNLVLLTDNYNDVKAIGSEYEAKEHAEYLYGRFKLGFDYMKGEEIVLAYDVTP